MCWNSDGVSMPSHRRRSENEFPSSPVNERKTVSSAYPAVVRFKIFDSRPGVKNDHAFTGRDFSGGSEQFQSCETSSAFGTDEETFPGSNFTRDANHFFVIDGNCASIGFAQNFQNQEIADCFWNPQAGSNRVRVLNFCTAFFSELERADDRRATGSLHRKHARPVLPDPAECFHFVERFPHPNKTSAAASRIKNHIGQLPVQLLRYFVTERLFSFDAIRLFQRRHVEPPFICFAPADFRGAIRYQSVDQGHVSAQFTTLNNVRARCVARHEDVRLHARSSRVCSKRATGISRAGNRELCCAEMFCHRNSHTHAAGLEALGRIQRLVFDPKIDAIGAVGGTQQRCSAFAQRGGLNIGWQRQHFAVTPQRFSPREQCLTGHGSTRRGKIDDCKQWFVTGATKILQPGPFVLKPARAAFETLEKHGSMNVAQTSCLWCWRASCLPVYFHLKLGETPSCPTGRMPVLQRDLRVVIHFNTDELAHADGNSPCDTEWSGVCTRARAGGKRDAQAHARAAAVLRA